MVIYKGKVLHDFGDTKKLSHIASCRKSVLSMLYGQYLDKGIIDLDKTMADLGIDDNNTELLGACRTLIFQPISPFFLMSAILSITFLYAEFIRIKDFYVFY
jgi:hypothetical protein